MSLYNNYTERLKLYLHNKMLGTTCSCCEMFVVNYDHHIAFRNLRQKDVTKFHVQLALSLILMLVVFVAGIDRTENKTGCIIVGVLLHYLILVAWMWMAAEALLLFQKLVIVFTNVSWKYLIILSVMCWGKTHSLSLYEDPYRFLH